MRTRFFAPVGKEMSVLVMGSTGFGVDLDDSQVSDVLDAFFALGGNCIDTARVYGDFAREIGGISEQSIGRWIKRQPNRAAIVLGTKGGHPPLSRMRAGRLDRASVRADLSQSLDALQTDYADIYWLHRDDESRPVEDIMDTLGEIVAEGRARAVGASNWSPARIEAANAYAQSRGTAAFSLNQPQWSLARMIGSEDPTLRQMDAETYAMHARHGLACMPYSSQAKGFFTKYFEGGDAALSRKARDRFLSPENLRVYEALLRIRSETGASVGALALAYLTCQPFPVFPIVGVSRLSQVAPLAEAGEAVLRPEDMAALIKVAPLA